jgi:hypothetical protein
MAQGSEPSRAALCGRDHQVRIHDPGHRRQNDGKFGLEESKKSAVRPHGQLISG